MFSQLFIALPLLLSSVQGHPLEERKAGKFKFFDLPTPLSGICDLAEGPDGALWGEDILVNKIFRLEPGTNHIDEFDIPFTTPIINQTIPGVPKIIMDRTAFSCAIRPGADGNMYATNGLRNQLVRINTQSKQIKVFDTTPQNPAGNLFPFNDLFTADDGIYVTQTTGNVFQFFDFKTEKFTTFDVPTKLALPLGLFVASDKLVYIAELIGNKILIFNPATKKITEVPLPVPLQAPAVIRVEKDGFVYFTLFTGNGLGRINMKTHKIDLFHSGQLLGLGSEDTGPDQNGNIYLSFFTVDGMARLDPSEQFTLIPFPDTFAKAGGNGIAGDLPPNVDVAVQYGPGNNIWFGSILHNQLGRYSLS